LSDPGRSRIPAAFSAGAVAVLGFLVAAPPAQADAMDVLQSAVAITIQAAAGGVNVVETVTFSKANDLRSTIFGGPSGKVPAGGRVRVHIAANSDGSYYETFRRVPSAALVGLGGRPDGATRS
jgi:hypothetical protein